jgi:hypothetical protein
MVYGARWTSMRTPRSRSRVTALRTKLSAMRTRRRDPAALEAEHLQQFGHRREGVSRDWGDRGARSLEGQHMSRHFSSEEVAGGAQ